MTCVSRIIHRSGSLALVEAMRFIPHSGMAGGAGWQARKYPPKIAEIQRTVASFYGLEPSDMTSSRRGLDVARPRQVAMYLARKLTPRSFPDIGRFFGNRDHTTVIHAVQQIDRLIGADIELAGQVDALREKLA